MRRQAKSHLPEDDDGRTIADMNVDGMPWYTRRTSPSEKGKTPLSKDELRAYRWAALKSALLIVLIFGAVFALFLAFCDFIWFKK